MVASSGKSIENTRPLRLLFKRRPRPFYKRGSSDPLIQPCVRDRNPALEAEFAEITRLVFPRYQGFDQDALEYQNRYRLQQTLLITFGLLATAAGGLQTLDDDLTRPLGVAEALLGVVLAFLASRLRRAGAQRGYVQARLAAERLRGEAFLFLTRAGPYEADQDRAGTLDARVAKIAEATLPDAGSPVAAAMAVAAAESEGRDAQAFAVYRECRLDDQRRYYGLRRLEYEKAARAAGTLALCLSWLTVLLGVITALAGENSGWVLPVVATAVPALGTALAGYAALYGFERLSKLYGDAEQALLQLAGASPADPSVVGKAEEIMRREQGQWGQFADETPIGGSP
jgi:hypothetical protein